MCWRCEISREKNCTAISNCNLVKNTPIESHATTSNDALEWQLRNQITMGKGVFHMQIFLGKIA